MLDQRVMCQSLGIGKYLFDLEVSLCIGIVEIETFGIGIEY